MPYVNIKITNPSTTIVVIDEVETDNWGIGGVPVTELRKKSK